MTRVFDVIGHYGDRSTEKRAMRDPAYRTGRAARETGRGTTIVADEEAGLGVDGFVDLMQLRSSHRPWWWQAGLRLHWWMEDHGIRPTWEKAREFCQRGNRGWSDRDMWALDTHLATVIRDAVQRLNDVKYGWPGDPMTYEEWGDILDEIVQGMQASIDLGQMDYRSEPERQVLEANRERAMDLLKQWWFHLGD